MDSLVFGPPKLASSTHNAHYEQHSQSSCHHTTKEHTTYSRTHGVSVYVVVLVTFMISWWQKDSHCMCKQMLEVDFGTTCE